MLVTELVILLYTLVGAAGECTIPPVEHGSHNETTAVPDGGSVTYTCDDGYVLKDDANNTLTCHNFTFPGIPPLCVGECSVKTIPPVEHGSHSETTAVQGGGNVTYKCDDGYVLKDDANNTLTCHNFTFPGIPPLCVDADECDLGTHACDAAATCINTNGTYTCTCNSVNTTVLTSKHKIYIRLNVSIVDSVILDEYKTKLRHTIASFYNRRLRACVMASIMIDSIWNGSLNVNYTVTFPNSPRTHATIADIHANLAYNLTLPVLNQSAAVLELHVQGVRVPEGADAINESVLCMLYTESVEGCPIKHECVIVDRIAACQPVITDTSDNLCFTLVLTVGIPLTLLVCFLIFVVSLSIATQFRCCLLCHGKMRDEVTRHGVTSVKVEGHSIGRVSSLASSAEDTWGRGGEQRQSVSWDFLSSNANPQIQYRIERPRVQSAPLELQQRREHS